MNQLSFRIAAIAGVALATSAALAGPQVDYLGQRWGVIGNAGPWEFKPVAGSGLEGIQGLGLHGATGGGFITFCMEIPEGLGATRFDVTIDTVAYAGGGGSSGIPLSDPLDAATAYLYQTFMNGTLSTGGFTYLDGDSGLALQQALWALEEELTYAQLPIGMARDLYDAAVFARDFGAWGNTIGNVRIMNLYEVDTHELRQSQLVIIPLPGTVGLATAGLASLFGFGILRRRR